jgi:hypothetical protein
MNLFMSERMRSIRTDAVEKAGQRIRFPAPAPSPADRMHNIPGVRLTRAQKDGGIKCDLKT